MANEINITDLSVKAAASLTTADYLVTFTDDGNTTKTPAFEAISQANTENGCLCVLRAKLEIPSADVLTLNTTPVSFGLTVPSGYYVNVLGASASISYNTVAYATNTQLQLTNGGAAALGTFGNNFLASTVSKTTTSFSPENPTAGQTQVLSATDVFVIARTGDPTAGNSDITIYLTYVLIEI